MSSKSSKTQVRDREAGVVDAGDHGVSLTMVSSLLQARTDQLAIVARKDVAVGESGMGPGHPAAAV